MKERKHFAGSQGVSLGLLYQDYFFPTDTLLNKPWLPSPGMNRLFPLTARRLSQWLNGSKTLQH